MLSHCVNKHLGQRFCTYARDPLKHSIQKKCFEFLLVKMGGAAILCMLVAATPAYTNMMILCHTTPLALQSTSFPSPPVLNKKQE